MKELETNYRYSPKNYENNNKDAVLIEGLARIYFYLGNRKESIRLFRNLYDMLPDKREGRLSFLSSLNYIQLPRATLSQIFS